MVRQLILRESLITQGQTVVCGVSGGADSVALLHCLCRLGPELEFTVCAAHLNHRIRGAEADEDQRFVTHLCHGLGVPLYAQQRDVPALAKRRRKGLEQVAREARYDFFERAQAHFGAQVVAVAHHREDQAETVLLHLLRGSGTTGMAGMRPRRGNIIRPLLEAVPAQIAAYLARHHLSHRLDSTNLTREATRNRLRLDVIPYLKEHVNADVVGALCSAAQLAQRDEDYLCTLADDALMRAQIQGGYDRRQLRKLPLPVRTRALRKALALAGIKCDIERVHIEMLCNLLEARTGAQINLPGIEAIVSYDTLHLGRRPRFEPFETAFILPGVTQTPRGRLRAMLAEGCNTYTTSRSVGCLDADKLPPNLVVRSRANGDRFHPVGAPGDRKLKDVFIDRKLPRFERELPLLCAGKRALFVPGQGVDDSVRVTQETQRVLWIEYLE